VEDGKLILEDPYKFEVTLRQGGNNYYNWYCKCEFIKDYPSTDIYEQVQKADWTGTGFAIADGYIATNYHVTNGAKTIKIRGVNGDQKEYYRGYLVASDRNHDLAIIKIVDKRFDGFDDIPYCLGKSVPEVGNDIFVLGYPMTETMGKEIKLTNGIISAASGYKGDQSMYQISAAVQPGSSGGPLFDNDGNVIGIVCAKHSDAENANYAIKVSYLLSLINSSDLGAKLPKSSNVDSKSISKIVKQVQPFVYMIECRTH
jgi:S1-C subfamily serine protease